MASLAFRLAWRGTRSVSGKSRLRVKPRERHNRLCLEWLEHRCLPSTVTTLADDGPGSLRVALTTTQPGGTVDFLPGLIGTITVAQRLEIDHNLAIAGPGAGVITISGNSSVQVFHIASSATVRVSGLTITNGFTGQNGGGIFNEGTLILSDCTVSGNRAQSDGGGINNTGTLIVSNCTLSNNGGTRQDGEADTQRGGGIYNTGTLTISTSTLAGNNANANGAGLCNRGTLTVNSTTLSDNGRLTTVLDPRGFAEAIPSHGGGIYNDGTLMVTNSTLSGNSADDAGGGIYNQGALSVLNSTLSGNGGMNAPDGNAIANNFLGTLTVRNTTFSDNGLTYGAVGSVLRNDGVSTVENSTFSRNKGYLGALDNTGSLTITNSTFYRNQSTEGGAIVNDADNGRVGTLAVSDTTFAGNTASSMDHGTFHGSALSIRAGTAMLRNSIFQGSQGDNLYVTGGAVLSQGYNLSNDDGSGFLTDFTDLIHTDPLLGPLQDNGGPTQTVALLPRSPALNTGDPTVINTADQRGVFRTGGANRGAYEASASSLSLAGLAATNTLCVPTGFSVMAKDLFGQPAVGYRGTVHFTSSGRASLPEDYTFTAADGGMHTFQATFRAVGIQAISVQDTASSALAGTQGDLTIIPAEFSFSEFPFPITAGSPLDCTVTVTDANGNPALGYCDAVQFASSDPLAHLLSNSYTFTAADKGVHLFKHLVTFETVGTDLSLTVTDATTPSLTFTKTDLKVVPSNLILGGFSSDPAIAGSVQNFTVTLQDAYANRAQGYVDTVRFRSDDPQAILPADYAFTTADRGTHTFQVIFKTAGTHALTATDVMAPLLTDTHMSLRIVPAPATTLVFGDFSSAFTKAGTPLSFTVTAKDPYGNQAIGYSGTVQLTSSDGRTALLAAYSFTAADQGQHQFQVTFKTAGAHMLTITDAMDSALTTTQGDLAILPTDPVRLEISTLPVSIIAGAANAFVVTVRDAYGNPVTGYRGTVELTSSDPKAVLPAGYTFTSADQGQHQFQVMFKKAGFRDLTVTDSTAPTLTMTRASILVKPAEPHELAINPPSASTNAGAANAFVITVFDAYGNLATGYEGTLHFASSDPRALVPADHTFTSDDQGAHTFFATFQTAGIQSLIATDTEDPSLVAIQPQILVRSLSVSTPVTTTPSVQGPVTVVQPPAIQVIISPNTVTTPSAPSSQGSGSSGTAVIEPLLLGNAFPVSVNKIAQHLQVFGAELLTAGNPLSSAADPDRREMLSMAVTKFAAGLETLTAGSQEQVTELLPQQGSSFAPVATLLSRVRRNSPTKASGSTGASSRGNLRLVGFESKPVPASGPAGALPPAIRPARAVLDPLPNQPEQRSEFFDLFIQKPVDQEETGEKKPTQGQQSGKVPSRNEEDRTITAWPGQLGRALFISTLFYALWMAPGSVDRLAAVRRTARGKQPRGSANRR